jgi:hypothetical protein
VFVESVLAASACLNYLQTHLSQEFYKLAWPIDELKTSLIGNLDDAINKLPHNTTIVLDASSPEHHNLALEAAAYLNLRREPLRAAALRFIICWPVELKNELLTKAPDLWSMRVLSPFVTNSELVFPSSNFQNEVVFENGFSTTQTMGKLSLYSEKKLTNWERHHDLKLADLSELDAIVLAKELIHTQQYSLAVELSEAVLNALKSQELNTPFALTNKANAIQLLSFAYSQLGNTQAALLTSKEAESIYRRLAKDNPEAFEPHLAMCVNNLAISSSKTGDRVGALAAAKEAVAIYTRLAAANPAAFESDLAVSLKNLAIHLSKSGDRAGTLKHAQEALAIYESANVRHAGLFDEDIARGKSLITKLTS